MKMFRLIFAVFFVLSLTAISAKANSITVLVTLEKFVCKDFQCDLVSRAGTAQEITLKLDKDMPVTEVMNFSVAGKDYIVSLQAWDEVRGDVVVGNFSAEAHKNRTDLFGFISAALEVKHGLEFFQSIYGRSLPQALSSGKTELFVLKAEAATRKAR